MKKIFIKKYFFIPSFQISFFLLLFFSSYLDAQIKIVSTSDAPAAIGPYSQAVVSGNLVFCSGQIALHPVTMQIVGDDIESQTRQVFSNIKAVLKAENLTLANVVKCTVFMKNLDDFAKMNSVYAEEFGTNKPARSTIQAARIPKDVLIEIECIAVK
ncbi:MAG: RidA family protein [Ignavibacteriales bacterium]|nr:RidA family protein [Ignavibacteriales bacterium]